VSPSSPRPCDGPCSDRVPGAPAWNAGVCTKQRAVFAAATEAKPPAASDGVGKAVHDAPEKVKLCTIVTKHLSAHERLTL
jgi:hypothetical protein